MNFILPRKRNRFRFCFLVHLPFGGSIRYLVIKPLEVLVPSHEDQSIGAKTVWGPALRGLESCEPQVTLSRLSGYSRASVVCTRHVVEPTLSFQLCYLRCNSTQWCYFCDYHFIFLVWTLHSISYLQFFFSDTNWRQGSQTVFSSTTHNIQPYSVAVIPSSLASQPY